MAWSIMICNDKTELSRVKYQQRHREEKTLCLCVFIVKTYFEAL
jgi:hypothetical protein